MPTELPLAPRPKLPSASQKRRAISRSLSSSRMT
jgi:hypothetical protein